MSKSLARHEEKRIIYGAESLHINISSLIESRKDNIVEALPHNCNHKLKTTFPVVTLINI
jgi:hypothetical protein